MTHILYHGTSDRRWREIRKSGMLRKAPLGDLCVSLTTDYRVARYFADNACDCDAGNGRPGSKPVVLQVDASGLDTAPHFSAVWGEGLCDWELETACWEDVPLDRVSVVPPARAFPCDRDVKRIQRSKDGPVLAFAMRLSNDRWALCDTGDRRIGRISHERASDVAKEFDALSPDKGPRESGPKAVDAGE